MTKDTDPDLRFMALNDLEREMANSSVNVSSNQLIAYSEILLRCLDDEFSEVRTQSLKCFESVSFRLRQDILPLIKELSKKKPKKISITSTIYTMALHNILKNLPPNEELYTSVIGILLPEILEDKRLFFTEIDYIEILNDIATYIGNFMTKKQIANTLAFLNDAAFNADTIIAKKSILACNALIKNIDDDSTISAFIDNLAEVYKGSNNPIEGKITFLSIFAAAVSGNPGLMSNHITQIWEFLLQCLQINEIQRIDDDYEAQQKSDMLRLEVMTVLVKVFTFCRGDNVDALVVDALSICQVFVSYDPYKTGEANSDDDESLNNEEDENEETDDDYSDYEQDDDDDDNDDFSWKLRVASLSLLTSIIQNFPIKLPLVFKYNINSLLNRLTQEKIKNVLTALVETLAYIFESSSSEGVYYSLLSSRAMAETTTGRRFSDVSMQTDDDPYTVLLGQSKQICDCIAEFIEKSQTVAIERIDLTLKLLAKLTNALGGLDSKYIQLYIVSLNKVWTSLVGTPEAFSFFSALLKFDSLESFGNGLLCLIEYLRFCLSNDTNHRLVIDGLNLVNEIFDKHLSEDFSRQGIMMQLVNSFTDQLLEKINNKTLSTEIRLQSLNAIVSLSCKVSMDTDKKHQILGMFTQTISTEVLAYNTLNAIAKVVKAGKILDVVTAGWLKSILDYALEYLSMSELNNASLKVIKEFSQAQLLDLEDGQRILNYLEKLHSEKMFSSSNCVDIGVIMAQVLKRARVANDLPLTVSLVVDLCAYDKFDDVLLALMSQLLKQNSEENLTQLIQQFGKTTDLKISKMLAVLTVVSRNDISIGNILENLRNGKDLYFSLIFLNQVSKSIDLNIGLEPFLMLFSSQKQNIVNMSVKTVSTIVSKYSEKYLHEFLDYLKQTTFLTPSFKCLAFILNNSHVTNEEAGEIFQIIVEIEKSLTINVEENTGYENAASCLSTLITEYGLLESMLSILSESSSSMSNLAITIGSTPKFTFPNETFLEETSLQLLVKYAEQTTNNYIFNNSLRFKETGISNLNLFMSKKPNIAISLISKIMPNIMESEIKANKEYVRTQFIGPYKHKIDDGLNYRKQIFESIYYLFKTLEDNKNLVFLCNIKWALYFNKFFDCGIKDDQSIASVCLLTVLKLFEREPYIFDHDIGDVDIFDGFINRNRKALSKKIADNAVKQDIEKQNNLVKMIIRFLKKTNILVENNKLILSGNQRATWSAFISEARSKFPIFNSED
ncbi:hypothetical protein PMKS-001892 [Pichia membranifaciens]|uniref:TATA-binding protein interacting (TIP20) domain-containing protein n=1 Tax=Pichia membranifaciens TaxID=4926 RepID=A0A1Q2YG10_9ASCO|nr:hypothetical protein PMKS-001892 [Pichia membranifaciens]